jgi:drug/metabolite transporter (DMT)-like permease
LPDKKNTLVEISKNSWLQIHVATFLFGTAGLFAKFIMLPASWIVFGRVLFASLALIIIVRLQKHSCKLNNNKDLFVFVALGIILAIHWLTFFYSIKISTVAIGLLAFSSFPIFVALFEPLLFKERYYAKETILALITVIGLAIVIPEYSFDNNLTLGLAWGVISGLTFAIISIINKKYVASYPSSVIALYQDSIACIALLPFIVITTSIPSVHEWIMLFVLGVLCTAIAHSLFINSMKTIKASHASIIVSLEPLYGIVFALLLLDEVPSVRTILGGLIILGAAYYTTKQKA